MTSFVGRTAVPAPHGELEAIYRPATDRAERVALVLHPHPLYGGTMHNKVVYLVAKALEESGVVTLRFNFRGVGTSTGGHDHGRGEVDDARAALDFLLAHQPAARDIVVAGFSFGAAVGLRFGCDDARVHRLIAIGTPTRGLDAARLRDCAKPIAFIHGDRDELAPLASVQELVRQIDSSRVSLHVIPGADHFFERQLAALRDAVRAAVDRER